MHIRIATLNAWGLPEPLSDDPAARMHAIGERLPALRLDAIAFQEVWTAGGREQLRRAGKKCGLEHVWGPHTLFGGSGLLLLSRWPILVSKLTDYALRGHPEQLTHGDYYGRKGYVRLRLATPAGPVSLIDTHLHARYAADVGHEYVPQRVGQIVQLALGAHGVADPLVAVGDFNFTDRHVEHRLLTDLTGLRDVARELDTPEPTVLRANPLRRSRKPDRRVDYVFARDGSRTRAVPRSIERIFDDRPPKGSGILAYSNHAGLLAEIEISPVAQTLPRWQPRDESIALARRLLASGREAADDRRLDGRVVAGAGLGFAALAAVGRRSIPTSRRRFLRTGLSGLALLALTPSIAGSALSEVLAPNEIRAYEDLSLALDRLRSDGTPA